MLAIQFTFNTQIFLHPHFSNVITVVSWSFVYIGFLIIYFATIRFPTNLFHTYRIIEENNKTADEKNGNYAVKQQ